MKPAGCGLPLQSVEIRSELAMDLRCGSPEGADDPSSDESQLHSQGGYLHPRCPTQVGPFLCALNICVDI